MNQGRSILPTTKRQHLQPQRHYPTPQDVSKALEHLAKRLPVELAEEILRQAEYWPRLVSHVRQRVRVEPLGFKCEAWSAYLVSEAIPKLGGGNGGPAIRIERVKFKMESRDQLWGGDQSFIRK
ncbi:hypothetical protein AX16_002140 [Volvariella volvacea WC 439]|nr:hypothetical protein AX16_002140 [Volvariella volvacea WC 439]